MKILALHRQKSAVAYYRTWLPCRLLKQLGHDVTYWESGTYHSHLNPKAKVPSKDKVEQWLKEHLNEFDVLFVDRAISNEENRLFAGFRHYSENCRMIVDTDDLFTDVPWWNSVAASWQPGQENYDAGLHHFRMAEMLTVSTEPLAEAYRDKAHRVRVLHNHIDPADWEGFPTDPTRADDPHVRILYGGASGHYGDIDEARSGIEALIRKPPVPVRLICLGSLPGWAYDLAREFPGRVVNLPWVPFEHYPRVIAWGGFDMAIAPLREHPFNRTKSLIKVLEAGIQGIPIVVSKVGPYAEVPDGCAVRVDNTPVQWAEALRATVQDAALRASLKEECGQWVRDTWTLDKAVEKIQLVFEEAASLPRIVRMEDTFLPSDRT